MFENRNPHLQEQSLRILRTILTTFIIPYKKQKIK